MSISHYRIFRLSHIQCTVMSFKVHTVIYKTIYSVIILFLLFIFKIYMGQILSFSLNANVPFNKLTVHAKKNDFIFV